MIFVLIKFFYHFFCHFCCCHFWSVVCSRLPRGKRYHAAILFIICKLADFVFLLSEEVPISTKPISRITTAILDYAYLYLFYCISSLTFSNKMSEFNVFLREKRRQMVRYRMDEVNRLISWNSLLLKVTYNKGNTYTHSPKMNCFSLQKISNSTIIIIK